MCGVAGQGLPLGAGFGRGELLLRGTLCLSAIRPLYPHNLGVLLKFSKIYLLMQKPYTCRAQSGCKTLGHFTRLQLITAEHTELLDRNDANVRHIILLRIICNCLVRHTELLCYCVQTLLLSTQPFDFFDGVSIYLRSSMLFTLSACLGNAGTYPL